MQSKTAGIWIQAIGLGTLAMCQSFDNEAVQIKCGIMMVDIFLCSRQVLLNNLAVRGFPLQCMQAVNEQYQHQAYSMSCVQVTTRLPKTKAVMFTFRTYIRPLRVLEERTEVMQRLLAAFTALPDDVVSLCESVLCHVVPPCRS